MSADAKSDTIRVEVSADRLRAELVIPPHVSLHSVTVESVRPLVEHAEVEWTDDVAQRVAAVLAQQRTPGKSLVGLIARGTLPLHGTDGRLEWTIDSEHDQQSHNAQSHYDRSAFILVSVDQTLGRLYHPTPGTPGRDVTGKPIPAIPGKPVAFRLDDVIVEQSDGALTAITPGLLVRNEHSATIQSVLTIDGDVDFSTGNIDFQGSIVIHRGVKDRFHVKASQAIQITGLVEAAVIDCGGDLHLNGGFAGREQGTADVAGHMHARYLDGVTAHVRRDLVVTREIINCDLTVHGNLIAPAGSVIGGCLVVAGRVQVANLGSGGGVATRIVLGSVPRLDVIDLQLNQLCDEYHVRRVAIEKQLQTLRDLSETEGLNEAHERRLGDLQAQLAQMQPHHDRARQARDVLRARIESLRVVDLSVVRRLNEGVVLEYRGVAYRVRNSVSGPVHVCLDPSGVPIYETRTGGGPLGEIAEVVLPHHHADAA